MAYNTKPIVKDKDGNPISQYYNPNTDQYEPVKGAGGGSAVILYNEDGTENNSLSLMPILDKLSELTGTVIDEETRKSNELQRIEFYNQLQKMLADGELKGDKGDTGLGLQFDWKETSLGVKVEGNTEYIYVDLKGPQGPKGETGDIDNLNRKHIENALGYLPTSTDDISTQITAHNESEDAHEDIREDILALTTKSNKFKAVLLSEWDGELYYSKNELGVVHVYGTNIVVGNTADFTTIARLPDDFRPDTYYPFIALNNSSGETSLGFHVSINGNIVLLRPKNVTKGDKLVFNFSYMGV